MNETFVLAALEGSGFLFIHRMRRASQPFKIPTLSELPLLPVKPAPAP